MERVPVLLRMPEELKTAIAQDAFDRRSNMTDEILALLVRHYRRRGFEIDWEPSRRRSVPFGGGARK